MSSAIKKATAGTVTLSNAALAGGSMSKPSKDMTMQKLYTSRPDRAIFLETSSYDADGGHQVGKDPRQILVADFRRFSFPESPIKAIRAKCIDCSGGSMSEARKCTCTGCPLWPMRMGVNPFHASRANAAEVVEA